VPSGAAGKRKPETAGDGGRWGRSVPGGMEVGIDQGRIERPRGHERLELRVVRADPEGGEDRGQRTRARGPGQGRQQGGLVPGRGAFRQPAQGGIEDADGRGLEGERQIARLEIAEEALRLEQVAVEKSQGERQLAQGVAGFRGDERGFQLAGDDAHSLARRLAQERGLEAGPGRNFRVDEQPEGLVAQGQGLPVALEEGRGLDQAPGQEHIRVLQAAPGLDQVQKPGPEGHGRAVGQAAQGAGGLAGLAEAERSQALGHTQAVRFGDVHVHKSGGQGQYDRSGLAASSGKGRGRSLPEVVGEKGRALGRGALEQAAQGLARGLGGAGQIMPEPLAPDILPDGVQVRLGLDQGFQHLAAGRGLGLAEAEDGLGQMTLRAQRPAHEPQPAGLALGHGKGRRLVQEIESRLGIAGAEQGLGPGQDRFRGSVPAGQLALEGVVGAVVLEPLGEVLALGGMGRAGQEAGKKEQSQNAGHGHVL